MRMIIQAKGSVGVVVHTGVGYKTKSVRFLPKPLVLIPSLGLTHTAGSSYDHRTHTTTERQTDKTHTTTSLTQESRKSSVRIYSPVLLYCFLDCSPREATI